MNEGGAPSPTRRVSRIGWLKDVALVPHAIFGKHLWLCMLHSRLRAGIAGKILIPGKRAVQCCTCAMCESTPLELKTVNFKTNDSAANANATQDNELIALHKYYVLSLLLGKAR